MLIRFPFRKCSRLLVVKNKTQPKTYVKWKKSRKKTKQKKQKRNLFTGHIIELLGRMENQVKAENQRRQDTVEKQTT